MGVPSLHPKTTSTWGSISNLANSAIGAGVLSFPMAYKHLGYGGGALFSILVSLLTVLTLAILVIESDKYKATSYHMLVKKAIGTKASSFIAFCILIFMSGSLIAYLIIVGDTFSPILGEYVFGHDSLFADRRVVIVLSSLIIVLPFCLQRNLSALTGISGLAVAVMVYTGVVILGKFIYKETYHPGSSLDKQKIKAFTFNTRSFSAIPIMIFAFQCHAQVIPIFYELNWEIPITLFGWSGFSITKKARLSQDSSGNNNNNNNIGQNEQGMHEDLEQSYNNDSFAKQYKRKSAGYQHEASRLQTIAVQLPDPVTVNQNQHLQNTLPLNLENFRISLDLSPRLKGMFRVIIVATVEMFVLYNMVGVCGYMLFGESVESNIIKNFQLDDTLIQVTRGLIGLAVIFHYPINIHVARGALDQVRRTIFLEKYEEHMSYQRLSENTLFLYILTVIIATQVQDLGFMFQIMGGTISAVVVFVVPGILLIKDSHHTNLGHQQLKQEQESIEQEYKQAQQHSSRSPFLIPRNSAWQSINQQLSYSTQGSSYIPATLKEEFLKDPALHHESTESQTSSPKMSRQGYEQALVFKQEQDSYRQYSSKLAILKVGLACILILIGAFISIQTIVSVIEDPYKGKEK